MDADDADGFRSETEVRYPFPYRPFDAVDVRFRNEKPPVGIQIGRPVAYILLYRLQIRPRLEFAYDRSVFRRETERVRQVDGIHFVAAEEFGDPFRVGSSEELHRESG